MEHSESVGDDATALDLDALEAELAAVEASLERLDAGTYGICEVTGAQLPDDLLEADPTARRLPPVASS
jgi:RNA polymerase-binding transcription factor DksA